MNYRKIFALIAAGGLLVSAGCASVSTTPRADQGMRPLTELCEDRQIFVRRDGTGQIVILEKGKNQANFIVGSDRVLLNGEEIMLNSPTVLRNSAVYVPGDFLTKVIEEFVSDIVSPPPFPIHRVRKVVIDAGHGGKDPGAIGRSGLFEKDVVLDIVRELERLLTAKGLEVTLTRDRDEFISLQRRTEITSESRADAFVSIHANSNPVVSVNGVEVYSLRPLSEEEMEEEQRQINLDLLTSQLKMSEENDIVPAIINDMYYVHKMAESDMFADHMARTLSNGIKAKNLGRKDSRFFVVRNTLVPAILVEVGFLSNPKEERLLATEEYRKKIAQYVARGILDYAHFY